MVVRVEIVHLPPVALRLLHYVRGVEDIAAMLAVEIFPLCVLPDLKDNTVVSPPREAVRRGRPRNELAATVAVNESVV